MTDQQISIDFTVIRGRDKKVQGGSSHFSAPSLLAHFPHRPSERNGMVTLLSNPLQTSSLEVRNSPRNRNAFLARQTQKNNDMQVGEGFECLDLNL